MTLAKIRDVMNVDKAELLDLGLGEEHMLLHYLISPDHIQYAPKCVEHRTHL